MEYEEREVWWEWSGRRPLRSVLVVLKSSLWTREKKVRREGEFTIFAFYVNMLTTSWMYILNKADRKLKVTVKWMQ